MTRVKIWSEAIFSCWSSFYLFNLKIHPSLLVSSKSLLKTNEICWVGVFSVVGHGRKSLRTTAVNQVFTPKLHDEHYGVWCVMSQKECKSPKCDYESRIISLEHTHPHTCTKTHVYRYVTVWPLVLSVLLLCMVHLLSHGAVGTGLLTHTDATAKWSKSHFTWEMN